MVGIKNRKTKAYVLLESLVSLFVLITITSLFLSALDKNRKHQQESIYQQEILNVAKMAMQTGQDDLTVDGIHITVYRLGSRTSVYHEGKEIVAIEKN